MRNDKAELLDIVAVLGNSLPPGTSVNVAELSRIVNRMRGGSIPPLEAAFQFVEWCDREKDGAPDVLATTKGKLEGLIGGRQR